ncbi:hypothetical protein [Psychrobacter sp. WY6]|uniref:hypothetical protein n=1 Tax=Psychrobacter sp. WY6 TaxID=2708350 RepID=UPI002022CF17|nr:hypothetical protein [Psychrobacter sp. WY6]
MQAGVDSLPLLSAENEAQLITELQTQQSLQTTQQQDFDTITKQLGWLDDVAKLKQSLAQNLTALTNATR